MKKSSMQELQHDSYLSNGAGYLEGLYEQYLQDPQAVSPQWQSYFSSLPKVNGLDAMDVSHEAIRAHFVDLVKKPRAVTAVSADAQAVRDQVNVNRLINGFRIFGHLAADIDPLKHLRREAPQLDMSRYDLSKSDFSKKFRAESLMGEIESSLESIFNTLKETYCESIGVEFMHLYNADEVKWIQQRLEHSRSKPTLTAEEKKKTLELLTAADGLEKYLGHKYIGQKRFSLEGGDSLIPLMHEVIQRAGSQSVKEVVIGMAHRGRLNVLINIMGQSAAELFEEFEGVREYSETTGDVKYHLGFSSDVQSTGGPVHLTLAFNPSHLEIISPVIEGSVRARQHLRHDNQHNAVLPIAIHGDAAFSGQGIVMETLNMSQTRGYGVGGTIHLVINNQVGFTTSNPHDARSSRYCTGIAKMIEAPIFHVNADDPEAVIFVARLALDYRMKFNKDVVIDLVCYRLHGHNEADEPSATQPMMYQKVRKQPVPREIYFKKLLAENICQVGDDKKYFDAYRMKMDNGEHAIEILPEGLAHKYQAHWSPYLEQKWDAPTDTSFDKKQLVKLAKDILELPKGFQLQRQVAHVMAARKKMAAGEQMADWGFAENLAYATLLKQGYPVRITGQDVCRGTFAHRHATLHDQNTGETYTPLTQFDKGSTDFQLYDSLLSEAGVMGFEFGYAKTDPHSLVIWEAQFGDFANGAQVVIDQFISSAWQKWKRLCGLVLFLPHGCEGLGPEHSSARLERFCQLAAQHNMQICVPTTPAQTYHMIRRQMIRPFRKPLIVMTPKSLLRHKAAVSSMDDLAGGKFHLVLPEVDKLKPVEVTRVIMCSGKVYYDLLAQRREQKRNDIAIIRLEQLYPFPYDDLKAQFALYKKTKDYVWCQEEPKNQGAWYSIRHKIEASLQKGRTVGYVGRQHMAAPAVGYAVLHKRQQEELVAEALG